MPGDHGGLNVSLQLRIYRLLNISRPRCVDGWSNDLSLHAALLHSCTPQSCSCLPLRCSGWYDEERLKESSTEDLKTSMIDHAVRRAMDLIGLRSKRLSSSKDGWKAGLISNQIRSPCEDDLYFLLLGTPCHAMPCRCWICHFVAFFCPPLHKPPIYAWIYTPGQFLHACGTSRYDAAH